MQRAFGGLAVGGTVELLGRGHLLGDGAHHPGRRAPGDLRRERGGVDDHLAVVEGAGLAAQLAPALDRGVQLRAVRSAGPALRPAVGDGALQEPGERGVVGRDHPGAPAALDRHVADGHAALHRERLDRGPGVLDDVPGGAADAHLPDRAEDQVLGGDAEAGHALVADQHRLGLLLDHALGRQDVLDLARADPEGQRAEGAVGRGVGVPADDRHAGLGNAELGTDDVHDPLAVGAQRVDRYPELGAVALQGFDLDARELVLDARGDGRAVGRRVVVGGGERAVGPAHLAPGEPQPVEGLGTRDLVHEVQVDVQQVGARSADLVGVPELVEQGLCHQMSSGLGMVGIGPLPGSRLGRVVMFVGLTSSSCAVRR